MSMQSAAKGFCWFLTGVTMGAAGALGSAAVQVAKLYGAQVIVGDVVDQGAVEAAMGGMDGCFHLAAIASVQKGVEDWPGTHRVNAAGTL